jgi:hypothetical protein
MRPPESEEPSRPPLLQTCDRGAPRVSRGAEGSELTQQIDLGALREYRDTVGLRTREVVGSFQASDWDGEVSATSLEAAAATGAFGTRREGMVKAFTGRPRAMALSGIALFHPAGHLGEAITVRSAGGFGTGI